MRLLAAVGNAQIDFNALENAGASKFANAGPAKILGEAMGYIFPLAGFLVLIVLVVSGFQYMTSYNDPKIVESSQKRITWAIVGFLVLFSAYWITQLLGKVLGIQAINNIFP